MKHRKNPTREQRKYIAGAGLDTYTTKVIKDTKDTLEVVLEDGSVVLISKEKV